MLKLRDLEGIFVFLFRKLANRQMITVYSRFFLYRAQLKQDEWSSGMNFACNG